MNRELPEPVIAELERKIRASAEEFHLPGAAVGVVRDGVLAWFHGYGYADVAAGRRPDENTLFRIASITKTFTATAIVRLRDDGRLSVEDPAVKHIPELERMKFRKGSLEQLTLQRLLSHHSGIVGEAFDHWETFDFVPMKKMLERVDEMEVVLEPDSAFKYSNLAYGLLGEVVARVSGRPYETYVEEEILRPLKLDATVFRPSETLRPRMAVGYDPSTFEDVPKPAREPDLAGISSAGQLHSCVADLARWIAFQLKTDSRKRGGAEVLSGKSVHDMHRPRYVDPGWNAGFGLGFMSFRKGNNIYCGHGGGLHGFITQILFSTQRPYGAVVLTNMGGHMGAGRMAMEVLEILMASRELKDQDRKPSEKPAETPRELKKFVGQYRGKSGGSLHVEFRSGRLCLDMTVGGGLPKPPPAKLDPTDEAHVFTVETGRFAGEPLTFRFNPAGEVTGFFSGGFAYHRTDFVKE